MSRLGVLGGSFDPVHRGHLHVALLAREAAELDEVIFVPAASPPHKDGDRLAPPEDRVAMLEAALAGEPATSISRVEIEPGGPRYTVDTLAALRDRRGGASLLFILGEDSLRDLPGWRNPDRILDDFGVIAVDRPGVGAVIDPAVARRCLRVTGNPFGISATDIRARVRSGKSIRHLVPAPVEELIRARGLYGARDGFRR